MARKTSIPAKLTRPRLYDALARQRLFAWLDAHRDRPVIWLAAPPGAGKTTLVASWLDARGLPGIWYQLDAGDGDPAAFFSCLRLAAQPWTRRRRVALPLLAPEYLGDLAGFARRWFRELFGLLPHGAVLVMDNYHEVPTGSAVAGLVREAAGEVPGHASLVVVSRADPPAELASLRACRRCAVLGWDELRLTLEETAGMAGASQPRPLDDGVLRSLHAQCDGWAAGVVLMLERLRQTGILDDIARSETMEAVFDYIAGQVFDRLPARHQQVLIHVGFLPHATPEQAQALSGDADAGRILAELYRRHLLVDRRFEPQTTYRLHALFRAFLQARARDIHAPVELAGLARCAAQLLEEDGQPEAAIALFRQAGDAQGIARIVLRSARSLLEQGRHRTLAAWLDALPPRLLESDAWLCFWQGAACHPFDPGRGQTCFERAFELFRPGQDRAGLLLSWVGVAGSMAFDQNADAVQLRRWVAVLDELMARDPTFPSEEIESRVAGMMYGVLAACMPWHAQLEAWKQRALALARSRSAHGDRMMTLYTVACAEIQSGNLAQAWVELESAPPPDSARLSPLARTLAYSAHAFYQRAMGRLDASLETAMAGLEAACSTGVHAGDFNLRLQAAHAALLKQDLAGAGRWLHEMAADVAGRGRSCHYHYIAGWLELTQDNLAAAGRHAALNLELSAGWWSIEAWAHSLLAAVLHRTGQTGEAARHLAAMLAIGRRCSSHWIVYSGLLTEAEFAFDAGHEQAGLAALRQALALGRAQGFMHLPRYGPATRLSELCARALQAGIEVDYVRAVIRSHRLAPGSQEIEHWPWPVKLFTLGSFALLRDGQPVRFSHKAPKKPLALLKAIVAFGGKGVSDTQLAEALWPDLEGDAAHEALASALHRLRRLLGREEAITLQDGRVTLDPKVCWVDAWAFQRLSAQAERAACAGGAAEEIRLTQRALELYRGAFLPADADQPWTVPLRERLHSVLMRRLLALAQRLEGADDEAAIAWYRRGIEADTLAEAFYLGLMRCCLRQERHAEGLALYRRLQRTLWMMLGIAPSAAAEALHEALLAPATAP